jgi:uncharacterized protein with PQ loop repeat
MDELYGLYHIDNRVTIRCGVIKVIRGYKMDIVDTLGVMAGIISAVAFLPQVIKVWRTQSTTAISSGMYTLYCIGLLLWGIHNRVYSMLQEPYCQYTKKLLDKLS